MTDIPVAARPTRSKARSVLIPGVVLAVWTLLLWTTRVRNALDDTALVGWSRTWQVGVSVVFVTVGIVLLALSVFRPAMAVRLGAGLAVIGSIWWIVRGTGIVLADYSTAFTVVHVILAVGTVVLSAWFLKVVGLVKNPSVS